MRKILLVCLTAVFTLASSELWAQERTVSGRVTSSEDASPLPGVNVVLKGTTNGAVTDSEGAFNLSVPQSGGTLVFTFIGLKSQEVEIGARTAIDIQMEQDATQLSEVVVTALGVKREAKTLPYAAQTVSSEKLNITRANNVNDALAGKVAGVQVRGQSGAALGRNSGIRIRGAGSLTDKAPLYVVDGTPVETSEDFNPDDVETINVLKGPAATALYGQRGEAGVVMITTKKGKKGAGMGISVSNNLFFDNVYILPRYQNDYAGGASADLIPFTWQTGMPEEWKSLDGQFYHDYTDDASWGPRMVGQQYIPWYAWLPGTKYTGQTTALVGQPNNIRDFYKTGVNRVTNVAFGKSFDDLGNARVSYTNQGQTGIMPNTWLKKNTLAANTTLNLSKLVTVGANINYVSTTIHGEFDDGYSNQSTGSFNQWFHRNLDMKILKELQYAKSPEGRLISWNHQNPNYYVADSDGDGVINGDKFYRGYYWYNHFAYMNLIDYESTQNRLFGDVNVALNLTDRLKVQGFYRKNQRNFFNENKRPSILPYSFYVENRPTSQPQWDFYGTNQTFFKEDNLEGIITYNTSIGDNIKIDLLGGGNLRMEEFKQLFMNTTDGLVVPDLYTINNSKSTFGYGNFRAQKQVRSLYARANFGFKETFFLDVTGRNDWSSTLPSANNSYFYPSVGATFIFSELTESALPVLSFGKLSASYAQTGTDAYPYFTKQVYGNAANTYNGNLLSGTPDQQVDPNIKPALSSALEFGLDVKFLEDRLGLQLTYFDESKRDEIIPVPVSGASGFGTKLINAGQIDRQVFEVSLMATPVKTGNLTWDITLNWAKTDAQVVKLAPGVSAIPARTVPNVVGTTENAAATFGVGSTFHVEGERWGQMRGVSIQRNADGVPILDADGLYIPTESPVNFGSVLPDFTGGVINNIGYKNFNLQFNVDFQKGGKFFSLSDMWGTFSGLTQRTAGLNDLGNPIRDAVEDGGGVHVTGVDENGEVVDMYVPAQDYYHQFYFGSIADPHILDLSYVKLREVSLSYNIPVKSIGSLGNVFTSASIGVVGRNLWLINGSESDFDPSEVSATFGENGQLPSVRSYGFNIKLGF
ncbi:MAG TPA: SusC/RagA family TonB-linked outer membrane protein [Chryseosolibacter sp.]